MAETFKKYWMEAVRDSTALGGSLFYFWVFFFLLALQQYQLFFVLLFGFVFTFIVVVIIRLLYFHPRPQEQRYHNIIEKIDASSFPSWHSARITFFSLLLMYYFDTLIMTLLFTALAVLVAYSRIYLQKHDWRDVIGGIILGFIAYGLTLLF